MIHDAAALEQQQLSRHRAYIFLNLVTTNNFKQNL